MKQSKKLPFLIAACLSTVVLAIINSSFGPMLAPITENYLDGESASRGYPNSAMQIGCIVAVLLLAVVGGRLNGRRKLFLMSVSMAVLTATMLALGTSPAFLVFVAIFAVVGLAYGTVDVLSSALVADVYGESASGMMCLLHGSHGAAGIIAPIVIASVLSNFEKWSLPYTLIGGFVLCVLAYLILLFALGGRKLSQESASAASTPVRFDKKLIPFAASICLYGIYLVGMICYTESYETSLMSESDAKALTLSLLYLGLTVSRLSMPDLRKFFKLSSRTYLTFAPFIASGLLFIGVLSQNGTVYIIMSAISSFVAGAFIPITISLACELMVGNTTGASTYMNLAMLIGNSVASPLIGAVGGAYGIGIGMIIPPVALAVCGVFVAFANKKKKTL